MAKRELSSYLKNMKFMQRAVQNEDKQNKEVEFKAEGDIVHSNAHRKCVVIMEGSPHPGALKGRMSFRSFNPSIDKLNDEGTTPCQSQASTASLGNQTSSDRENESSHIRSEGSDVSRPVSDSDVDQKRKQPEVDEGAHPNKIQKL